MADANISDEAVTRATGADWAGWLSVLDGAGAQAWAHPEIARYLSDEHGLSGWWSQMVTVEYERRLGRREVGETTGGFEVSVQRTVPWPKTRSWEIVTAPGTLKRWLGLKRAAALREGSRLTTVDGHEVEVRRVRKAHMFRVWFRDGSGPRGYTALEVHVGAAPKRGRSVIGIMHRRLGSQEQREAMRVRWRSNLDALIEEHAT